MVENKLGGEVGITTPSTAIKLFRRRFMGRDGVPELIPRWQHWAECVDNKDCMGCAHDWIRRGYYGGRTEIFALKGEGLHYYDINSSYVATMREEMPIGDRIIEEGELDWRLHRNANNPDGRYSGFCECLVYIPPDCEIPPLPHRNKKTGKLIFPTGFIYGVWSMEELILLFDPLVQGKIVKITKTVWFQLQPMFGKMVEELWKLRDKSLEENYTINEDGERVFNTGLDLLAKLLGNSTYGKLAMKQERTSVVFTKDVKETQCFLCKAELYQFVGVCENCQGSKPAMPDPSGDVWYQAHKVDANYIIPHVSAHITARARVRLWNVMKMVIQLGGKLYYLDTDSCITNIELPTSTELGALKNEYPGKVLNYMAVQPKVYMLEMVNEPDESKKYKVTMKGFPPIKRTKENLEKLMKDETVYWNQLEKVRTLARLGFRRPPKMKDVQKSFQSGYDKRILNDRDGTTRAIFLDERDMVPIPDRVIDKTDKPEGLLF